MEISVVIMAGGKGERFWPQSLKKYPKQFLPIVDENQSMIEATIERALQVTSLDNIFISIRKDLVDTAYEILPQFPKENFIIEPIGRDTAAAMGLATFFIEEKRPGSIMIILPSDHLVQPIESFADDVRNAAQIASDSDCLITFGIKPTRIDTGYGHIELGEIIHKRYNTNAYEVKQFTEKPDKKTAELFLQKGNFVWNSGMFIWKPSIFKQEMERSLPEHYNGLLHIQDFFDDENYIEKATPIFENFEKISVDYGIMEKASNVLCLKANFQWDDVGSWTALERINKKDESNNITKGLIAQLNTEDSILLNYDNKRLVSTLGVKNLIIINTKNAVLVLDKNSEQDMKKLIKLLQEDEKFKSFL